MERVREAHSVDGDLRPVTGSDDLVCDAGGREDGRQCVVGRPQILAHAVDIVPLVRRRGNGHVVGVKLELVKLPLEDEQGS